jgi:hypothetical protein
MGILAMGKTKPESMKKGRMKKKVVIMACCWVFDTVEMNNPMPRVLRRKRQTARKRAGGLPARGISNQKIANKVTTTIWSCL